LDKKEIIREEKLNKDSVNFIKFSFDNKYLLTASVDGSINIFLVEKNFELIHTIKDQEAEINWLEWHPKGPAFAFGTAEGSVWVYVIGKSIQNFNFFNHIESCTCGQFYMEGKKLISGGEDAAIKIYNLKEQKMEMSIKSKKFVQNPITCLDICKSKDIAVVCSIANEFCLINYQNGNILYYRQYASASKDNVCSIENVCFCNNDLYIVYADSENHLNIFEMKSMSLRSSITIKEENITKIIPSKKRPYEIYCSGSNGYMYIFDTRGVGTYTLREKYHKDVIMDFVVTEDENFVITSSIDKTINLVKVVELKDN
jgi:WD40 repeat protein